MDAKHYNPQKLINLRESKKWTQDDLATKLNVTRETISRVETGKNASYEILCDYTGIFDLDVTEVLYSRPIAVI